MIKYIATLGLGIFILSSCVSTKSTMTREEAYGLMYKENTMAIAAMPPINKTNNVEAKEYFYGTLTRPLAERGYYVLPSFLTMEMFKSESAYDSEMFINGNLKRFGEILGADAVLFTTIHRWEKAALNANITVEVEYTLKSTHDNSELYSRRGTIVYDVSSNSGGGGLVGALVGMAVDAINTATTSHVSAARAANIYTLSDMPSGKYQSNYQTDMALPAGEKIFKANVKK